MEQRKSRRVAFKHGIAGSILSVDGTWRRQCRLDDVSETGANITIMGSFEGLQKEFFLLLSSPGIAYRQSN